MGIRDWFISGSSDKKSEDTEASALEEETQQKEAFAELQDAKTDEALSLFDEEEPPQQEEVMVAAPYDAGDASLEDLLAEIGRAHV